MTSPSSAAPSFTPIRPTPTVSITMPSLLITLPRATKREPKRTVFIESLATELCRLVVVVLRGADSPRGLEDLAPRRLELLHFDAAAFHRLKAGLRVGAYNKLGSAATNIFD